MPEPRFNQNYKGLRCRVCLIRESETSPVIIINQDEDAYELVKDELVSSDREILLSIMLTTKNHLIGVETVSIGTLNDASMTPREVFKCAILANSASIILCHNHPSGELIPSPEDIQMTNNIIEAGDLLGILVFDHLIVSVKGFVSLRKFCKFKN